MNQSQQQLTEDNQRDILKYIQNERDISNYKILSLEKKGGLTPSQCRILHIEKEFLTIPFEKMDFEDVADVAAAIYIYRNSRISFYKTYGLKRVVPEVDEEKLLKAIKNKLEFLRDRGRELMTIRVQEINLIQCTEFYVNLVNRQALKNRTSFEIEKRELDSLPLEEIIKLEPSTIAKKRARLQAATYSIGKYLYQEFLDLREVVIQERKNLQQLNVKIDNVIDKIKFNIFKYYNEALEVLPQQIENTMGQNTYLFKMHKLQNILEFSSLRKRGCHPIAEHNSFDLDYPKLGNIYFGLKKTISLSVDKDAGRKVNNKVYGILIPIPHKGNEKMTLLYKNIIADGMNLNDLFVDKLSNIKAYNNKDEEEYFKAVLMYPLWKLIELADEDDFFKEMVVKLLSIKQNAFDEIDFNDEEIVDKINSTHTGYFNVEEDSVILVPKTRSEEDGFSEIFPLLYSRISEIKDDYYRVVANNGVFID